MNDSSRYHGWGNCGQSREDQGIRMDIIRSALTDSNMFANYFNFSLH
jgi:hypothetical protein